MAAFSKSLAGGSYGRGNLFATVAVILGVAALFLIPEIVGYHKRQPIGLQGSETSFDSDMASANIEPTLGSESGHSSNREVSPLVEISRLFGTSKAQNESLGSATEPSQDLVAKCVASLSESAEKKAERVLSETPLTWEKIRSPEASSVLQKARSESVTLLKALPAKSNATRYALYNYINGISAVQNRSDEFEDATGAMTYLESLDQSVTRAMFQEGVDRSDFLQWSKISLGEELSVSRSARIKSQYRIPFNPRLALSNVVIRQPYYDTDPKGDAYLDFEGFVVGKDVSRVELIWNNGKPSEVALRDSDLSTGRREFYFTLLDARGTYTIKVYDNEGDVFSRSYSFYEKARSLVWGKDGYFKIPFRNVDDKIDPRFDRFFRAAGGESGSNQGFSTF